MLISRPLLPFVALLLLAACNGSDPAKGDTDGGTSTPGGAAPFWSYRVLHRYPHDTDAYTQGLVFVDGDLLEGTGGGTRLLVRDVPSSLRRVDLETGQVRQRVDLDMRYFGEGVALLDGLVYQLTWRSRVGFVYDLAELTPLREFAYGASDTTGWGLTDDDEALWLSDGSSWLSRRDPRTFTELSRVQAVHDGNPVRGLNELEWVAGEIWANVYRSDIIARIDPASGAVVGWIDLRGLLTAEERRGVDVLNGIAWDPAQERIFVTGKLWPWVFEIELVRED